MNISSLKFAVIAAILFATSVEAEPKKEDFTPEFVAQCKAKAEGGDAEAQAIYGWALSNGWGVETNYQAAVCWLQKAAMAGNAIGQCNLGVCYEYGTGVEENEAKAVEWYRKAADQGYAQAQCNLGVCYKEGVGVEKDAAKAVEWYRKAAVQGDAQAQCALGICFYTGEGVEQGIKKAIEWWTMAATQGYVEAQVLLGVCYEEGEGVNQDLSKAAEWYAKAAEQGSGLAKENLKRLTESGNPVSKLIKDMVDIPGMEASVCRFEVTQALWKEVMGESHSEFKGSTLPVERVSWKDCQEFIEKLNALSEIKAAGFIYRLPTAKEWEHACRAGASGDYCKLADDTEISEKTLAEVGWYGANSHNKTHPVGEKSPNAFGLYDMLGNVSEWTSTADGSKRVICGGCWDFSAENCKANVRAGIEPGIYSNLLGFRLVRVKPKYKALPEEKDFTAEFVALCKAKAETGDTEGQALYGMALARGWGVEEDFSAAVRLYFSAAEMGNALAQNGLGECFQIAATSQEDRDQAVELYVGAVEWYSRAAEQGLAEAQESLGNCYEKGIGVKKDEAKAVEWYRKAAEQGYAKAQYSLGICYEFGTGVEKDEIKAEEWLRRAAEQGFARAQYSLGRCYEKGIGVEKDMAQAVIWYRKAAEQNHQRAKTKMEEIGEEGRRLFYESEKYADGDGVEKDEAKSLELLRKAGETGWPKGVYMYGLKLTMLVMEGKKEYETESVAWLQKAIDLDDKDCDNARFLLAGLYLKGKGIPPGADKLEFDTKARQLLAIAAIRGHEKAMKVLKSLPKP